MKLILDDIIDDELNEYLKEQLGIVKSKCIKKDFTTELYIEYNKKTNPILIMKYIEIFQKYQFSALLEFDKGYKEKIKVLKYLIDDMCCEYCYKGLVMDLYENEYIKSVKSNFNFNKPAFNIEFVIEYTDNYDEEDLIEYIKDKYE